LPHKKTGSATSDTNRISTASLFLKIWGNKRPALCLCQYAGNPLIKNSGGAETLRVHDENLFSKAISENKYTGSVF